MQFLIRLWYKLPRFQIIFKLKKYNLDARSYAWYVQRKKYGFDEPVLAGLTRRVDSVIRLRLVLSKSHQITSGDFKAWLLNDEFIEDIKWLSERINKYIEWECPLYLPDISKYIENREAHKKEILAKYKLLLDHRLSGGNILDAEINFLHKHNMFGW